MTVLKTLPLRGLRLILLLCFLSLNNASKDVVKEFSDEFAWQDSDIPQVNYFESQKATFYLISFS